MSAPLLMIAPAMPAESGNGLAMRLGLFLEALATVAPTELIVVPLAGRAEADAALPVRLGVPARVVPVAGRGDSRMALIGRIADPGARLAALRAYGRPSIAAGLSAAVLGEVAAAAGRAERPLVHVGRLYLAEAGLSVSARRRTLDRDDDDAAACRGRAAALRRQGRPAEAGRALADAAAFAGLAARHGGAFDASFAARPLPGAAVVPNAVAAAGPLHRGDGRTILFVGALGHDANADGIAWFAAEAWPLVRRAMPAARLLIAGRDPPAAVRRLAGRDGIAVAGPVGDLAGLYRRAAVAIAPVRFGGGTSTKLIEAARHGVPFVATPEAARGLCFGHAGCGRIAATAGDFAAAVLATLADPEAARRRAARASALAAMANDRGKTVKRLAARLRALLAEEDGGA